MQIREARAGDSRELQELQARCPMGTGLIVTAVNTPDFFGRAKAYEWWKVYVACEGERIMGSAACAIRDVFVDGEVRRVGYEFQAFSAPEHRRKGLASGLHQRREAYLAEEGAVLTYVLILEANTPAMRYVESQGFRLHRKLAMPTIWVCREMDIRVAGEIGPARREELAGVAKLLNETWEAYNPWP